MDGAKERQPLIFRIMVNFFLMLPFLAPTALVATFVGTYSEGTGFLFYFALPMIGASLLVPPLFMWFAKDSWIRHTYGKRSLPVFLSSYIPVAGIPLLVLFWSVFVL